MCRGFVKASISVLMSVYNEPIIWIEKAIDSVLCQTFVDFEFIIVNDKPDRHENRVLLKTYEHKDARVRIIENEENIGLTKSLNKGLKLAKGKYIARMDADDISIPNRLQQQYEYMEENSDCLLLGANVDLIDENDNILNKICYPIDHDSLVKRLILKNCFAHPVLFYRKSIMDIHNIRYSEKFRYSQDYDFVTRVVGVGKSASINTSLLRYRKSSQQVGQLRIKEQDRFANQIRRSYIVSLLKNKFNVVRVDRKDIRTILWELDAKYPKNDFVKNMFLCLGFHLKDLSILDRFRILVNFKLSFLEKIRILNVF